MNPYSGIIIAPSIALPPKKQPPLMKQKEFGEYIPINYSKAIELTGCTLMGNRGGSYFFAKDIRAFLVEHPFYTRVSSQPSMINFKYNKFSKKVRFYNGGTLISIHTVNE